MKRCALKILNGKKYLRNNSSSRISKGKSPIKRIVRVEETSNAPLQARGEHRKIVMIKERNGTENQLNNTLQTVNNSITKRYFFKCEFKHCNI